MLPNIWWIYSSSYIDNLSPEDKQIILEFSQYNTIKQSINIDSHVTFWNQSAQFIIDIQTQIEKKEHMQLLQFLNKITSLIISNYLNSKPTLLFCSKYNEIGLAIWIYFFNKYAEVSYDNCIQSIYLKLPFNIQIPENLRRFLLLNIK